MQITFINPKRLEKPLVNSFEILHEVNVCIESLFTSLHTKFKTVSGDITPAQASELDRICNDLTTLLTQQISQNL